MKAQHTATPWEVQRLNHCKGDLWLQIGYKGRGPIVRMNCTAEEMCPRGAPYRGSVICESKYMATPEEEQIANADFIVLACNSHDALLKQRDELLAALETLVKMVEDGDWTTVELNDARTAIERAKS